MVMKVFWGKFSRSVVFSTVFLVFATLSLQGQSTATETSPVEVVIEAHMNNKYLQDQSGALRAAGTDVNDEQSRFILEGDGEWSYLKSVSSEKYLKLQSFTIQKQEWVKEKI